MSTTTSRGTPMYSASEVHEFCAYNKMMYIAALIVNDKDKRAIREASLFPKVRTESMTPSEDPNLFHVSAYLFNHLKKKSYHLFCLFEDLIEEEDKRKETEEEGSEVRGSTDSDSDSIVGFPIPEVVANRRDDFIQKVQEDFTREEAISTANLSLTIEKTLLDLDQIEWKDDWVSRSYVLDEFYDEWVQTTNSNPQRTCLLQAVETGILTVYAYDLEDNFPFQTGDTLLEPTGMLLEDYQEMVDQFEEKVGFVNEICKRLPCKCAFCQTPDEPMKWTLVADYLPEQYLFIIMWMHHLNFTGSIIDNLKRFEVQTYEVSEEEILSKAEEELGEKPVVNLDLNKEDFASYLMKIVVRDQQKEQIEGIPDEERGKLIDLFFNGKRTEWQNEIPTSGKWEESTWWGEKVEIYKQFIQKDKQLFVAFSGQNRSPDSALVHLTKMFSDFNIDNSQPEGERPNDFIRHLSHPPANRLVTDQEKERLILSYRIYSWSDMAFLAGKKDIDIPVKIPQVVEVHQEGLFDATTAFEQLKELSFDFVPERDQNRIKEFLKRQMRECLDRRGQVRDSLIGKLNRDSASMLGFTTGLEYDAIPIAENRKIFTSKADDFDDTFFHIPCFTSFEPVKGSWRKEPAPTGKVEIAAQRLRAYVNALKHDVAIEPLSPDLREIVQRLREQKESQTAENKLKFACFSKSNRPILESTKRKDPIGIFLENSIWLISEVVDLIKNLEDTRTLGKEAKNFIANYKLGKKPIFREEEIQEEHLPDTITAFSEISESDIVKNAMKKDGPIMARKMLTERLMLSVVRHTSGDKSSRRYQWFLQDFKTGKFSHIYINTYPRLNKMITDLTSLCSASAMLSQDTFFFLSLCFYVAHPSGEDANFSNAMWQFACDSDIQIKESLIDEKLGFIQDQNSIFHALCALRTLIVFSPQTLFKETLLQPPSRDDFFGECQVLNKCLFTTDWKIDKEKQLGLDEKFNALMGMLYPAMSQIYGKVQMPPLEKFKLKLTDIMSSKASNYMTEKGHTSQPASASLAELCTQIGEVGITPDLIWTALCEIKPTIYTFSKQQNAGIREIFVLDPATKILAAVVEHIVGILSVQSRNDMILQEDRKPRRVKEMIKQHFKKRTGSYFFNLDFSKWNQRLPFSFMIKVLANLVRLQGGEDWQGMAAIMEAIGQHYKGKQVCWKPMKFRKLILAYAWGKVDLPDRLKKRAEKAYLNYGHSLQRVKDQCPALIKLFDEWLEKKNWYQLDHDSEAFFDLPNGMGQGIFTVSSSVFGTILLQTALNGLKAKKYFDEFDFIQTSDDVLLHVTGASAPREIIEKLNNFFKKFGMELSLPKCCWTQRTFTMFNSCAYPIIKYPYLYYDSNNEWSQASGTSGMRCSSVALEMNPRHHFHFMRLLKPIVNEFFSLDADETYRTCANGIKMFLSTFSVRKSSFREFLDANCQARMIARGFYKYRWERELHTLMHGIPSGDSTQTSLLFQAMEDAAINPDAYQVLVGNLVARVDGLYKLNTISFLDHNKTKKIEAALKRIFIRPDLDPSQIVMASNLAPRIAARPASGLTHMDFVEAYFRPWNRGPFSASLFPRSTALLPERLQTILQSFKENSERVASNAMYPTIVRSSLSPDEYLSAALYGENSLTIPVEKAIKCVEAYAERKDLQLNPQIYATNAGGPFIGMRWFYESHQIQGKLYQGKISFFDISLTSEQWKNTLHYMLTEFLSGGFAPCDWILAQRGRVGEGCYLHCEGQQRLAYWLKDRNLMAVIYEEDGKIISRQAKFKDVIPALQVRNILTMTQDPQIIALKTVWTGGSWKVPRDPNAGFEDDHYYHQMWKPYRYDSSLFPFYPTIDFIPFGDLIDHSDWKYRANAMRETITSFSIAFEEDN